MCSPKNLFFFFKRRTINPYQNNSPKKLLHSDDRQSFSNYSFFWGGEGSLRGRQKTNGTEGAKKCWAPKTAWRQENEGAKKCWDRGCQKMLGRRAPKKRGQKMGSNLGREIFLEPQKKNYIFKQKTVMSLGWGVCCTILNY